MLKKALIAILTLGSLTASAQMLTVNDSKIKLEGDFQYKANTSYSDNNDGQFYTTQHFFYNPIFSPLTKVGVEMIHQSNDGGSYNPSNHYIRFGVNAMHVFLLPGKTTGIALTANLYAEASQHGVHRFDGVCSSLFMFKMDPKDSRGVGFVWLCNNPMNMIGLPIFTWKKQFGKHWSFNWMTWLGDFNYNFNEKFCLTASYGFAFERFWTEYQGQLSMSNQIVTSPALRFQYMPSKHYTFGIAGGCNLAFMGTHYNSTGTETLGKMGTQIAPFVAAQFAIKY